MSFQVLRIETYKRTSLRGLGGETERDGREKAQHKNVDIVKTLSYKNFFLKKSTQGFHKEWQRVMDELHVQSRVNKKTNVLDGMVITSDRAFFEKMGWKKGKAPTPKMREFFDDAYAWALKEIGFMGTDKNIISAVIHVDEETPHLHLYYVPVTERWREKQYAKGENGKILRNGKNPVYLRDKNGDIVYAEKTNTEQPRLNRDEFWRIRGGADSYALMQDRFFDEVANKWGLERGEKGSKKKHTTKQEYEKAQAAMVAHSVGYINAIEPHQTLVNRLTGSVTVNKHDFECLKLQAAAYAREQPQLDQAIEKERIAISREDEAWKEIVANRDKRYELDQREGEITRKEAELEVEKARLRQELETFEGLPEKLKDTQDELKKTKQDLQTSRDWAHKLLMENLGIDKSSEVRELERKHINQMQQKDKEHEEEVTELKDQIFDLKTSLVASQQDREKALDEERRKRKELEKKHIEDFTSVVVAKDAVIKSLSVAVRAMGWVLTSCLDWLHGDILDYARAAVALGDSVSVDVSDDEVSAVLSQSVRSVRAVDGELGL